MQRSSVLLAMTLSACAPPPDDGAAPGIALLEDTETLLDSGTTTDSLSTDSNAGTPTDTAASESTAFAFPPPNSATDERELTARASGTGLGSPTLGGVPATLMGGGWTATVEVGEAAQVWYLEDGGVEHDQVTVYGTLPIRAMELAVDASAERAWLSVAHPVAIYEVDLTTSSLHLISGEVDLTVIGTGVSLGRETVGPLAWDAAAGRLLVLVRGDLLTVDPSTGDRTTLIDAGLPSDPQDLVVDASGSTAWIAAGEEVVQVDLATGEVTVIADAMGAGSGEPLQGVSGLLLDEAAQRLLLLEGWPRCTDACALLALDLRTGVRTELVPPGTAGDPDGLAGTMRLAGDPSSGLLYAVGRQSVVQLDLATATGSQLLSAGPHGLKDAAWDGHRLLAVDYGAYGLLEVSAGATQLVAGPMLGSGPRWDANARALTWDAAARRVLIVDAFNDRILGIDSETSDRVTVSDTGGPALSQWSVHVAADGSIWAASLAGEDPYARVAELLQLDPATGERTVVSGTGFGAGPDLQGAVASITSDAAGDTLYVLTRGTWPYLTRHLYSIDRATGDRTLLAASDALGQDGGLVWHAGELLLGTVEALLAIDPVSASVRVVSDATTGSGEPFEGVAGNVVVHDGMAYFRQGDWTVVATDLATGDRTVLTDASRPGPLDSLVDLTVDDAGMLWALDETYGLVAIDPVTGQRVVVSR